MIKRLAFLVILCAAYAFPQAIRYDSISSTTNASCVAGTLCPLLAIPGTSLQVCQSASLPCTFATTYNSASAAVPCPNTAQITLPGTNGSQCLTGADTEGNFGFWGIPGIYWYFITLPATAGGGTYGPYPVTVHGDSGGYTYDGTCTGTFQQCVTLAGSGTLYVTRTWTVSTATTTINVPLTIVCIGGTGTIKAGGNFRVLTFTGAGATLQNCAVDGQYSQSSYANGCIAITGATNLTIEGGSITNCGSGGAILATTGCTNCLIENATMSSTDSNVVDFEDNATSLRILKNRITSLNSGSPALFKPIQIHATTSGSVIVGVWVNGNMIYEGNVGGIEIGCFSAYPCPGPTAFADIHTDENIFLPAPGYTNGGIGISFQGITGGTMHHNLFDSQTTLPMLGVPYEMVSSSYILADHNAWTNPVASPGIYDVAMSIDTSTDITADSNDLAGSISVVEGVGEFPSGPGAGATGRNIKVVNNKVNATGANTPGITAACTYSGSNLYDLDIAGNTLRGNGSTNSGIFIGNTGCTAMDMVLSDRNIVDGFAIGIGYGASSMLSITNFSAADNRYANISGVTYNPTGNVTPIYVNDIFPVPLPTSCTPGTGAGSGATCSILTGNIYNFVVQFHTGTGASNDCSASSGVNLFSVAIPAATTTMPTFSSVPRVVNMGSQSVAPLADLYYTTLGGSATTLAFCANPTLTDNTQYIFSVSPLKN